MWALSLVVANKVLGPYVRGQINHDYRPGQANFLIKSKSKRGRKEEAKTQPIPAAKRQHHDTANTEPQKSNGNRDNDNANNEALVRRLENIVEVQGALLQEQ
jgi:hypothetical protein